MERSAVEEFVAFDLETTGLRAEFDRVVEIGAVRFDREGRELGRFEQLVNPGRSMPRFAQAVHGLSDEHLEDAPPAAAVLPAFLEFLGAPEGTALLAHNASFDAAFLGRELGRAGLAVPGHAATDTLALARRRLPGLPNHRLDTIAGALDLDPGGPHRALADSLRVRGVWLALGGPDLPALERVSYALYDEARPRVAPLGWDAITGAIERRARARIEYRGGSHGEEPREVTPRTFVNRGGMTYLVAYCHLDAREKKFRLDRLARFEEVG